MLNVDKSWLEVINLCIKESENNNVIAQYITFLKSKPFQRPDFSYSYLCLILTWNMYIYSIASSSYGQTDHIFFSSCQLCVKLQKSVNYTFSSFFDDIHYKKQIHKHVADVFIWNKCIFSKNNTNDSF